MNMVMQDSIQQMFDTKHIKSVIYVDDEFGLEGYKIPIQIYLNAHKDDWCKFDFVSGVSLDIQFDKWWNDHDDSEKWAIIDKFSIVRTKTNIENCLANLVPDEYLKCIPPDSFNALEIKKSCTPQSQTLVLMDQELGYGRKGDSLLSEFEDESYVMCGLFSGTFRPDQEIEQWRQRKCKKSIYPLSKSRFGDDVEQLCIIEGLRNVLWLKQISEIKDETINLFFSVLNNVKEELETIDPACFDYAVINRSKEEGAWEFDSLLRLIQIMLNKHIKGRIISGTELAKFQDLTGVLKDIGSCFSSPPLPQPTILKELHHEEVFETGIYINSVYSQIANGDIFEIKGKPYMLVCQPCNIALRGNATRKSSDSVILLPILPYPEGKNDEKKLSKYISVLESVGGKPSYYVCLSRPERVCPNVLDLVSFNKDGKSLIDLGKNTESLDNHEYMQENMLKQYDKIYREVIKKIELLGIIKANIHDKTQKRQLEKSVKNVYESSPGKLIKPTITPSIVNFNICRIERYKEPYSIKVLQDFMGYMSRLAFPRDFSVVEE